MTAAHTLAPTEAASLLQDDEIHVWHLAYQPSNRRVPLLSILAAYLDIAMDRVVLVENGHGRPELSTTHASPLDFNWSHSGDQALIAIGRHISLGIDLEQRRERARALEIAERYFGAAEVAVLRARTPAERSACFLEMWTAKEAVLKALGRGIAFGLHRLDIGIDHGAISLRRFEGEDAGAWRLHKLSIDPTLIAAIAWRGDIRRVRLFKLPGMR
jgi:4'-phosphopantetheinyl transferase